MLDHGTQWQELVTWVASPVRTFLNFGRDVRDLRVGDRILQQPTRVSVVEEYPGIIDYGSSLGARAIVHVECGWPISCEGAGADGAQERIEFVLVFIEFGISSACVCHCGWEVGEVEQERI